MQINITLPNGTRIQAENGLSMEDLIKTLTAGGINLNGATPVQAANGDVAFVEPRGTRKGL